VEVLWGNADQKGPAPLRFARGKARNVAAPTAKHTARTDMENDAALRDDFWKSRAAKLLPARPLQ
jgi:hypothetical protein